MTFRKILWTLLATISAAAAMSGIVDTTSDELADQALRRALVTFAVARTLNGVISVAQGTELAVEPAGVGVILGVGQILDPINDLIERFSSVMLVVVKVAASSAASREKLLMMQHLGVRQENQGRHLIQYESRPNSHEPRRL